MILASIMATLLIVSGVATVIFFKREKEKQDFLETSQRYKKELYIILKESRDLYPFRSEVIELIGKAPSYVDCSILEKILEIIEEKLGLGVKKQTDVSIRTYNNDILRVIIGNTYGGEGYCGLTDGVDVKGELIEINIQQDSAIILSNTLDFPCAVKLRSLYKIS